MNSYVILFSALIVAVSANSVQRSSGWGAPPAPLNIDLELVAAGASAGAGAAEANLQVVETAAGDLSQPALIISSSGTLAEVAGVLDIAQVGNVDLNAGSASSINVISGENIAIGEEGVTADILGALTANAQISGASDAVGSGVLLLEEGTLNQISSRQ